MFLSLSFFFELTLCDYIANQSASQPACLSVWLSLYDELNSQQKHGTIYNRCMLLMFIWCCFSASSANERWIELNYAVHTFVSFCRLRWKIASNHQVNYKLSDAVVFFCISILFVESTVIYHLPSIVWMFSNLHRGWE